MKQYLVGYISLALAASMWGGSYVVSKYIMDSIPPITLVWFRYVIALAILAVFVLLKERHKLRSYKWTKVSIRYVFLIGFIGYFLSIILQFIGTNLADAHTGSLITSATPAFMTIFAFWVLKETLTMRKIVALIMALCGLFIVVGTGHSGQSYMVGGMILIGAAATWALMSIYARLAAEYISVLVITTCAIFIALLCTTPFMLYEITQNNVEINIQGLWSILYLGIIATALAFFLWNKGLELVEASVGSLFFFFQPLVGVIMGGIFLGEQLTIQFAIGAICIICAVIITIIVPKSSRVLNIT